MMAIIDQQRRVTEIGIIRIGEKTATGLPTSRKTFRLTSSNKVLLEEAQVVYGGDLRVWEGRTGQWELATERSEIKALFSCKELGNGDIESLSQFYEMWAGNTCLRRCDGCTCETWVDGSRESVPCICGETRTDPELLKKGKVCKIISRLRVMLPEVPEIGLWRLNTGSETFASETIGMIDQMRAIGADLGPIPLTMSIEFREKRTGKGEKTSKFPVVRLSLDRKPVSMIEYVNKLRNAACALPSPGVRAIETSRAPALPQQSTAGESIQDQVKRILKECSMSEVQIRDYKSVCESKDLDWVEMVIQSNKCGCTTADHMFEFLEGDAQKGDS
jgi:hypothetical protein